MQLKYNGRKTSNGGGTVNIEDYIFRGNSCFDPDFAVGGDQNQPLGFDEWSALYRRYRVIACKADVDFINDAGVSAFGYVTAENTSSAYTDRSNAMEPLYQKRANVGQDAGNNQGKISMYLSTAQVRGGPKDIVQYEADLSALVSANPTQEWFWHIGAIGTGSSSNNFSVDIEFTLTYYVEFYDRETLSRS